MPGIGSMTCAGAAAFTGAALFVGGADFAGTAAFVRGAVFLGVLTGAFVLRFVAGLAVFCAVGAGIGIFMPGIPGIACFAVSC